MCQYNLITHLEEIEDTVLIRTLLYPQLPNFSSDDISIRPLEMRPMLFRNSLSDISGLASRIPMRQRPISQGKCSVHSNKLYTNSPFTSIIINTISHSLNSCSLSISLLSEITIFYELRHSLTLISVGE